MEHLKQKKNNFGLYKIVMIIFSIVFVLLFSVREYTHYQAISKFSGKIWAINPDNGQVFSLNSIPFTMGERQKEYEAHTKDFIRYFYQFDKNTFLSNMDLAKNLMEQKTFNQEIDKYREERTYEKIQERDIILTVEPPKVNVDILKRPYKGTFSFIQLMRTSDNYRKRIIEGVFEIKDTQGRSDDNIHACIITKYSITRKEVIK